MNQTDNRINWSRIPAKHWVVLIVLVILVALAVWQSILPFLAERRFRDGYNFHVSKRYKYAVEELELAVKYAPWETHYQVQLGRSLEGWAETMKSTSDKMAIYNQLETLYLNMTALDKQNPWYMSRLASTYAQLAKLLPSEKEKYEALAITYNKKAAVIDSNNPLFHLNYAYYIHRLNKPEYLEEAYWHYNRVVEIDPAIVEARYNMADILRRQNRLNETLEQYLAMEKVRPDFPNLNVAIASTYITLGNEAAAIPYFIRGLDSVKGKPRVEVLKNLAAIHYRTGKWEKAKRFYKGLFEADNTYLQEYHQFYVQCFVSLNQYKEARDEILRFLKTYPNNANAKRQLRLLDEFLSKKST